ncbi:MAG: DUF1428 family protein [Brucellaceae bacterium]|nr:DUF1428 family protein [Brucellaceae bacterium]
MAYVSMFAASVPTAKKDEYVAMASKVDSWFRKQGATRVVDCWGADVPDGKLTSFPMAVKKEDDETVVVGWVEWPAKADADAAFTAMQTAEEFSPDKTPMPFDGKRMIFGGFDVIVDL